MKTAWVTLIISAITDFCISAIPVVMAAMMVRPESAAVMPSQAVVVLAVLTGTLSAMRTINAALKATPETAAALTGNQSIVATSTISKTP